MKNPLIESMEKLPAFSRIKPEHVKPAIEHIIKESRQQIESLLQQHKTFTWDLLQKTLDQSGEKLSQAWSPVSHLNNVVNTPEMRKAHDACLTDLSEFNTWLGQNVKLYKAYQSLASGESFTLLDQTQKKIIRDNLRDFKLSGVALSRDKKKRFADIQQQLSQLSSRYFGHVLDATMAWSKEICDKEELKGLPENALALAKQQAEAKGKSGYLLTLEHPSYYPVITYCDNRRLREEVYRAYTTRASDQGPHAGQFDNSAIMDEILQLRQELALLLEFNNYAEYSLATKMASSPEETLQFMQDLATRCHNQAKQELSELTTFARDKLKDEPLQAWDIAYFSEKLQQARYSISEEELRPWFPINKVLTGMFTVVERLYGITLQQQSNIDTWHTDVCFYHIQKEGQCIGKFYTDLYARDHKRDGAWMDTCHNRWRTDDRLQTPVAYLTCNFAPPAGNKPALLTHDDVVTLFHEFGHVLHHLLTQIDYPEASGIHGVPWDAVELPSQFMENWCWQKEGLELISGHYETGEPLPKTKLEQLLAARNFQSGIFMTRQLEFALFDMHLHMEYEKGSDIQALLDQIRKNVSVIVPPEFNRFQHTFSHIFDGGYAAGYYSYLWAEVLSADAFSRFEEEGIFNKKAGEAFLNEILSQGSSCDPMEMFIAFRGRAPEIDALLRHKGIMRL